MQKLKNIGKIIIALLYLRWLVPLTLKKIISSRSNLNTPESLYTWTQNFRIGLKKRGFNINFQPSQIKSEIIELINELSKNPPKIILEIGTATGGTLSMFTDVASDNAEIISIDLPFGRYGAGYLKYRIPLLKAFSGPNQTMHLIRADSHDHRTIEKLKKILHGRKLDFLFIDGDHSYNGVKADFENYLPFVSNTGMVAFHDIVENAYDKSFGTHAFWEEIKNNYSYKEYIRDNHIKDGCGIGLIKITTK